MNEPVKPRQLRPYQREAVNAVIQDWEAGDLRVAVVLPTGTGKSTVIAELALTMYRADQRVIVVTHRGELIRQIADAVAAVDPTAPPVGLVQGELDEGHRPIVAATLQTLRHERRRHKLGTRHVILWDEVHHAGAEGWTAIFGELGGFDGAKVAGFTATLRREDKKSIGKVIQKVSFERDIRWAINEKYLVPPRGLTVKIAGLDLRSVRTVAGDFQNKDLAEVMEASTESVVNAIISHCSDKISIVFAASRLAAVLISDALQARGMESRYVLGDTSRADRELIYSAFRAGQVRTVVTVGVLTEGADFPICDCVVIARPTQSQVLYSQMVGRALRPYGDKESALVVDVVGSSRVLSLVTISKLHADIPVRVVDEDGEDLPDDEEDDLEGMAPLPVPKQVRRGPIDMVEIDLLGAAATDTLWLQTVRGVPFMQINTIAVFLWPHEEDGMYKLGWMDVQRRRGDWVSEEPYTARTAKDRAERWVLDSEQALPSRTASWRRNQPPSEAQLSFARMYGIPDTEDMTKARLSDEISIAVASRALDPK